MNESNYLSEERYQESNRKVKKTAKILLIVGIVLLVVSFLCIFLGFLNLGNTAINTIGSKTIDAGVAQKTAGGVFGSISMFIVGGVLNTVGFILTVAGGITMIVAHRREIKAYTTQQVMPVAKESIEKMTPTVANAAGTIAQSISKGIQDGKKESGE